MYEFDEERWDQQSPEPGELMGAADGWLIQWFDSARLRIQARQSRYLQIGTGQWCPAVYATLFPQRCSAIVYAKEFGLVVGKDVRIVKHRF